MLKIKHLNHSLNSGGAAKAAYRIHNALLNINEDSIFQITHGFANNDRVETSNTVLQKLDSILKIRDRIGSKIFKLQKSSNPVLHSAAFLPSNYSSIINNSNIDIVNLHWINHEMISIEDIGRIRKPIVWTLHDMWPFCGAEHVSYNQRWIEGYSRQNRPVGLRYIDIDRWVWHRKYKNWGPNIRVVAPSNWMGECARKSYLMRNWEISVIPNPIDINIWKPISKDIARELLNLPKNVDLILFGGGKEFHKGSDLLFKSLEALKKNKRDFHLVYLGNHKTTEFEGVGIKVHGLGSIDSDLVLRLIYNACDVLAIPSRIDNFPNMALESMACGLPVVAFNICGLLDIVDHMKNGYLAESFDILDFSNGINWILNNSGRYSTLSNLAREKITLKFSHIDIAYQYLDLYKKVLN